MSTRALAEYAHAGDKHALQVFETAGDYLGQGIAIIANVLNPETVVIGGVLMRCAGICWSIACGAPSDGRP